MRYTLEERNAHVKQWHQSNLSKVQYCAKHNLGYSTFCKWHVDYKINEKPAKDSGKFIDLNHNGTNTGLTIKFDNGIEVNYKGEITSSLLDMLKNA